MSLAPGEEIGLEMHEGMDRFIRVDEGQGRVLMGRSKDALDSDEEVFEDFAILVPSRYWHNLINTGDRALKIYTIYGPPEHPASTLQQTKEDSDEDEHHH